MAYFHLKFGMDMSYNQFTLKTLKKTCIFSLNPAILNFTVGNRQKLETFKKKFIFALSSQNGTKKTWGTEIWDMTPKSTRIELP